MKYTLIFLAIIGTVYSIRHGITNVQKSKKDWWETAALYQIYPRSYKDSDGDGIGDLRGIIQNLDHLKDAGVQATWLSPIFKSPMKDFGYDISNFFDIQPEYGTIEDLEELVQKANKLGINIILDFVPNHSSDQCEWFIKSAERDPEYEDYYVWHPGRVDPDNPDGPRLRPNNWLSRFRGYGWTWNEKRGEYYLHQFLSAQPDLNFRNPKVREVLKDVLRFWLDKGVSGFRVDAVPFFVEDEALRDEPESGLTDDPLDSDYLRHDYTQHLPLTYEIVQEWRNFLDEYTEKNGGPSRIMLLEAYGTVDQVVKYYGNSTHPGAHFPFNFFLMGNVFNNSNAHDFKSSMFIWLDKIPEGQVPNWVMGNHDTNRVASKMGEKKADAINMLVTLLSGVSINYNGEEIAMEDVWISWNDTIDPQACNTNPEVYEEVSRDVARTPFQWDDSTSAGFSTSSKTWLPVSPKYKENNLAKQKTAERSHYKIYQRLLQARLTKTIQDGDLKVEALTDDVLAFTRELEGHPSYAVLLNLGGQVQTVKLQDSFNTLPIEMKLYVASLSSTRNEGDLLSTKSVVLEPYEALVLTS